MTIAVPLLVLAQSQSPMLAMLAIAASTAPYAFSVLFSGIIDVYERRLVFVMAEITQMLAVTGIILAANNTYLVMVLLLLMGTAATFSKITSDFGIVPSLLPQEQRRQGYSFYSVMGHGAIIIGPLLAGLVLMTHDARLLMALNALTFAVTAFVGWKLPAYGKPGATKIFSASDLMNAVASIASEPALLRLTIVLAIFNLGTGGLIAALAVFLTGQGVNPGPVIALGSVFGLIGAIVYPKLSSESDIKNITWWIIGGAMSSMMLLTHDTIMISFAFSLIYFFSAGINVSSTLIRQSLIPSEYAGRANAVIRTFILGVVPLSSIMLGKSIEVAPDGWVFAPIPLCGLLAVGVWLFPRKTSAFAE